MSRLGRGLFVASSALANLRLAYVTAAAGAEAPAPAAALVAASPPRTAQLQSSLLRAVAAPLVGGLDFVGHTSNALALLLGAASARPATTAASASADGSDDDDVLLAELRAAASSAPAAALPWRDLRLTLDRCLATVGPLARALAGAHTSGAHTDAVPAALLLPGSRGALTAFAPCWLVLRRARDDAPADELIVLTAACDALLLHAVLPRAGAGRRIEAAHHAGRAVFALELDVRAAAALAQPRGALVVVDASGTARLRQQAHAQAHAHVLTLQLQPAQPAAPVTPPRQTSTALSSSAADARAADAAARLVFLVDEEDVDVLMR